MIPEFNWRHDATGLSWRMPRAHVAVIRSRPLTGLAAPKNEKACLHAPKPVTLETIALSF